MSLPKSIFPLDGCTSLFGNTLYAYSSHGFQSLALDNGAQWSQLPMGVAVDGGVCVQAVPGNVTKSAALYIVGGTSNSTDYAGLQRYKFEDKKWETIQPTVLVTQNRLYHGAVYLNASDTILVYAGTQDGSQEPSTQTFTITAREPYAVLAYQSIAPPAVSPMIMQWSETDAVYIGGSESNTQVMHFNPTAAWVDSGITLTEPVHNMTTEKCVVVLGDDGSKSLVTFDMSVAPNTVNRTILVGGDQQPEATADAVASKRNLDASIATLDRRDEVTLSNLTALDWPAYNDKFVPTSTRSSYSLAHDNNGMVVISGGSDDDPFCIFDARANSWENAKSVLGVASTSTTNTPSNGTADGGATTSPSASATSTSLSGHSSTSKSTILAAVLGSIVGALLLLTVALILLRWRRKRRAGHLRRASGAPDEKYEEYFADMMNMPLQPSSGAQYRGHVQQSSDGSNGSFSSMAILMGRGGHRRGVDRGKGSQGSNSSSQFNNKYRNAISKPIPQEQPQYLYVPEKGSDAKNISFEAATVKPKPRGNKTGKQGGTRRSSGWNRYWSGGSGGTKRNTVASDAPSEYSDQRQSHVTQDSATIPPSNPNGRQDLYSVASGMPSVAHSSTDYQHSRGVPGQVGRPESGSSWFDDKNDAFSSGVPASINEPRLTLLIDRHDWDDLKNMYKPQGDTTAATVTRPSQAKQPTAPYFSSDMSWLNLGDNARR